MEEVSTLHLLRGEQELLMLLIGLPWQVPLGEVPIVRSVAELGILDDRRVRPLRGHVPPD